MPEKMHIRTRPAHEALTKLISELDKADLSGLRKRVPNADTSQTAQAWVNTLRKASLEIEEWCPSNVFTIDAPPKS